MLLFTGKGFLLKDGQRQCQAFKVNARNKEEAAFALNTAAGWLLVKPGEEGEVLGQGLQIESNAVAPEVYLKWPGQRTYEKITELKRGKGALRMRPEEPDSSTARVQKSMAKLKEEGGHRSTVRFSSEAYKGLVELASDFELNHSETLERLIIEEVARRSASGRH